MSLFARGAILEVTALAAFMGGGRVECVSGRDVGRLEVDKRLALAVAVGRWPLGGVVGWGPAFPALTSVVDPTVAFRQGGLEVRSPGASEVPRLGACLSCPVDAVMCCRSGFLRDPVRKCLFSTWWSGVKGTRDPTGKGSRISSRLG